MLVSMLTREYTLFCSLNVFVLNVEPPCRIQRSGSVTGLCCGVVFYPEGAVGNVDVSPGDDDGVFDGFSGNVDTEVGAVSVICDLYVDGETFCILESQTQISRISNRSIAVSAAT